MSTRMKPNQVEIDEALAASLLYDLSESTFDDAITAKKLQRQEEEARMSSLIDDEGLAKQLQTMEDTPQISLSDDENYAKLLQEEEYLSISQDMANHVALTDDANRITDQFQHLEVNRSTSLHHDVPSSSRETHEHNSDGDSFHSLDDMTYEEMSELGESIGQVSKGLPKTRIDQIPSHKFATNSWTSLFKKKKSENNQCSICITEYKQGDMVSTLPCAHIYHKDCISRWLERNKICCVCKAEVV